MNRLIKPPCLAREERQVHDTDAQYNVIDTTSEEPGSNLQICVPGGSLGHDAEAEV